MDFWKKIHSKFTFSLVLMTLCCLCLGHTCHHDDEDHYVSTPDEPSGPSSSVQNAEVSFSTGESYCSEGDSVQYRFDWGDSYISDWSFNHVATHIYTKSGIYDVRAQARCTAELTTSYWTIYHTITINTSRDTLSGMCLNDEGTVWVVGDQGNVLRYKNNIQEKMNVPFNQDLKGVWAGNTKVFICGKSGTILEYNGNEWKKQDCPVNADLNAISGVEGNLFIAGEKGTILYNGGNGWQKQNSTTSSALYGVWVHNSSSAFAVGAHGTSLYYNGNEWKQIATPCQENLYGVWGTDYSNVWAVGAKGVILRFDGNEWKLTRLPQQINLKCIQGVSNFEIYIGGDNVLLSWSNNSWNKIPFDKNFRIEAICPLADQKSMHAIGEKGIFTQISLEK